MATEPHSLDVESSVIGRLLADPSRVGEVVGSLLEPEHFYGVPYRLLYEQIVDRYYADDPLDALSVAESVAVPLSKAWNMDPAGAARRVVGMAETSEGDAYDHAVLVKRDSDYRALLRLGRRIEKAVSDETGDPEAIAADASEEAMHIATSTLLTDEIIDHAELGRRLIRRERRMMAARAQGIELGVYFGLHFFDNWTRGFQPTELYILAGEPGSGKSAVAWTAGRKFAGRQMAKPTDQRIGTLIASLEMSEEPSSIRVGQAVAELDGGKLREGKLTNEEMQKLRGAWADEADYPLYYNHASIMSAPQFRALVVEAIRRHKVGLVIVDHWRYVKMPGKFASRADEDGEKAEFFKQRIAKDLNVACMVLAHTVKGVENREGGRPKLSDLRGSGDIAAEADFVAFMYRPYQHASKEAIEEGKVRRTDAELIYEKNRHGLEDAAHFSFDPAVMEVK